MMRFQNQTIIITGASGGLGAELAWRFHREGANIALIARRHDKLTALQADLKSAGQAGQIVEVSPCDVTDHDQTREAISHLIKVVGPPDMLINNAGILAEGCFDAFPLPSFRRIFEVNYFGVVNCTKSVLPSMQARGAGKIVNIASLAGKMAVFGYSAYCSSKYAVVGLTETLRMELKPQNIGVHLVCPGEFDSPMVDKVNVYRSQENIAMAHTVPVLPIDVVAEAILDGIDRGHYLIIPGRTARWLERVGRLFPAMARSIVDFKLRKFQKFLGNAS